MEQSMKDVYAAQAEMEAIEARLTAYHEAGHVVLSHAAGVLPDEATMVGTTRGGLASVRKGPVEGDPVKALMMEVAIRLAGMVAQRLYAEREGLYEMFDKDELDKYIRSGGRDDKKQAVRLVKDTSGGSSKRTVEKMLSVFEFLAENDLKNHWSTVEAVAAALLKEYRLDRARLAEIIEASMDQEGRAAM